MPVAPAEVQHQRARQPADTPHGAIARGGVAALEPLDVIGDAPPELGVADALDSLAQELALHLDRDAVGAVGVEAGGDQAAREQAAREGLRLLGVVSDRGLARRRAGRHHGGETLRRELGREHFGEQVIELGVGHFARVARRQPIAQGVRQRVGVFEREPAQQEVVGDHPAQVGPARPIARSDPETTPAAAFRLRRVAGGACQWRSRYQSTTVNRRRQSFPRRREAHRSSP